MARVSINSRGTIEGSVRVRLTYLWPGLYVVFGWVAAMLSFKFLFKRLEFTLESAAHLCTQIQNNNKSAAVVVLGQRHPNPFKSQSLSLLTKVANDEK